MEENKLSNKYQVRKLIDEDISMIYSLCLSNSKYYEYCPPFVSKESIKEDMLELPPNKTSEDKYYIGFFDDNDLIAIMDLIEKYPNNETCFIGFFMVNKENQNEGIGSSIIEDLCRYLKYINYKYVRLAWIKGNVEAEKFWIKNSFVVLNEKLDQNNNHVIEAIRNI